MRLIFARCMATYSGRVDAQLELGDYLIIIKTDGTLLIHADSGLREKNWMPKGSLLFELPGQIISEFQPRGERLEIYIEKVYSDTYHQAELSGKLIKMGAEREMSDLIGRNLHLLGPGLELIDREARTPVGPIDVLALDGAGNPVAVEVKRVAGVGLETAYQLLRYLAALRAMEEWQGTTPRGIIVAPGLRRGVREWLEENNIGYVRLGYKDLVEAVPKRRRPKGQGR